MNNALYDMLMDGMEPDPEEEQKPIRALFGWPGGKDLSKEHILKALPYRESYIEHCGGTGIVAVNRKPSNLNVFNDRDSGVICFMRVIRDRQKMEALVERLKLTFHSREEFVFNRDTWEQCEDEIERAARWYYVVRFSFIQRGKYYGRAVKGPTKISLPTRILTALPYFEDFYLRLLNFQIENLHLFNCIEQYDYPGAVHYIDPPYWGTYESLYKHKFTKTDHAALCDKAMNGKGFFAISGYHSDLYDSYAWDEVIEWPVPKAGVYNDIQNEREREDPIECLFIRDNAV